jgi:hypothetical protein
VRWGHDTLKPETGQGEALAVFSRDFVHIIIDISKRIIILKLLKNYHIGADKEISQQAINIFP